MPSHGGQFMIPKRPKPWRSAAYLAFVRIFACLKCSAPPPSEAHHILRGDTRRGQYRAGDDETVPLCRKCHSELHDRVGDEEAFFGFIDYRKRAAELLKEWKS